MADPKVGPEDSCGLEALMKQYMRGSKSAFADLHDHLLPYVRRQIAARIRDAADVEDLTQLTFMRLHAARTRYRAPASGGDRAVIAWVSTIARNTAISHLRRRSGDRLCFDYSAQRTVEEAAAEYIPPAELAAMDEVRTARERAVRQAVENLPKGQRVVVERTKLGGQPTKKVAVELGLRDVAVRVRAHRAYKNLRRSLEHLRQLFGPNLSAV